MSLSELDEETIGIMEAYEDILVECLSELVEISSQRPLDQRPFAAGKILDGLRLKRANDSGYVQAVVSVHDKLCDRFER